MSQRYDKIRSLKIETNWLTKGRKTKHKMDLPEIFSSPDALHNAFEKGLDRQLEEDSLGTFILVLANSLFEEQIFVKFRDRLKEKFEQKKQAYTNNLRLGKHLHGAPDDILVFLELIAIGFDNLNTTEFRSTENWELQFNQLRALRPRRMSGTIVSTLSQDFDENAFHFNKPFLDKEIFWSGVIDGMAVKLLYNKFPFAMLHGLLVPEAEQKIPQILGADMHSFISSLIKQLGNNIPDIAIAYNGYGAGASINHLHFQTFTINRPLPVLKQHWQHNGGSTVYPVTCKVFDDSNIAWQYIDKLHRSNITYNLLYLPGKTVCLPRAFQGSYEIPDWTENFAWYELCGGITTFNQNDFLNLADKKITTALSALHMPIS